MSTQECFTSLRLIEFKVYIFQIRILQQLMCRKTFLRVCFKNFWNEIFCILTNRNIIRKGVLSLYYLSVQLFCFLCFKWKPSTKHRIKKNSTRPNIGWRTKIFNSLNDFRTHIRWSTAKNFIFNILRHIATKSKIY